MHICSHICPYAYLQSKCREPWYSRRGTLLILRTVIALHRIICRDQRLLYVCIRLRKTRLIRCDAKTTENGTNFPFYKRGIILQIPGWKNSDTSTFLRAIFQGNEEESVNDISLEPARSLGRRCFVFRGPGVCGAIIVSYREPAGNCSADRLSVMSRADIIVAAAARKSNQFRSHRKRYTCTGKMRKKGTGEMKVAKKDRISWGK